MAPCLSKFPSVCLEAIFKHVPLADLLGSIGLVCTSWYKSRQTELLRRKRLVLIRHSCISEYEQANLNYQRVRKCSYGTPLIQRVHRDGGSPWHTLETLEQFKFNCLSVPRDMKTFPFYSSLMNMSNITCVHLVVCITTDPTHVIRLLDHLSEHLADLNLDIDFYQDRGDMDTAIRKIVLNETNLIGCLNRLQSVRHLNLDISNLSYNPPLLSCLSHLTTFAIRATCFDYRTRMYGWIYASIKQYAQNVTSIQMENQVDTRKMLQFDAQLATKFNVLSVNYPTNDDVFEEDDEDFDENDEDFEDDGMQAISLFCARFNSLTKLKLDFSGMMSPLPMTKLARCLSSLTQLVHLVLDFKFSYIPPVERVQPEEGEEEDQVDGHGEQAQQKITQVPSVRLLKLKFSTKSHHDTERLFLADIFPNLQVLHWDHTFKKCSDCEIRSDPRGVYIFVDDNEQDTDPERALLIAECKRLTMRPFRGCAHLHTVAIVEYGKKTLIINRDDM